MKNKKKRDEVILSSRAGDAKFVSLIKDGNDGSYAIMATVSDKESQRSVVVAFGIAELDDARLIFDRQSKMAFDEICCKLKGE